MKFLLFVAASALPLATGACAPKPVVRAALDCPATQGDLTRTNVAADGRTCTYRTNEDVEVSLQLVNTNGDPRSALKVIETALVGTLAPAAGATAALPASKATTDDAARTIAQAEQDAGASVSVDVDVDGGRVVTSAAEGGETTRIDLPGIHIIAGENDADVRVGGITINASDDKATVRIVKDQRLKGEAFSREKRGLKATFIYTGENLPNGYRFVGYEAAGPKAGPLTVAVVRMKQQDEDHHGILPDVQRLVRRNSGV
jgi:hypothetical protein